MNQNNSKGCPHLTTAEGAPIGRQQALTAGPQGPVLMQDVQLLEQMQHFNRERIPERVVHAKGSGAYGTFTVTHDISKYTKAAMFSNACRPSRRTAVASRTAVANRQGGLESRERCHPRTSAGI